MLISIADEDDGVGARSQASAAYGQIRQDILNGRLAPGAKLKIADLAASLSVSPGAIREALSRLVPEHLVVSRDQRGFIVAPLSIEDLEDLTDLRCEVEAIALRRSVERGGDGWEAQILASQHRMRRVPMLAKDSYALNPEWVPRHAAFHNALVSACGSRRLLDLHGQLYGLSERYRGLSLHTETRRDVEREHQVIVDAALDRDADRLIGLTLQHIRETTQRIVDAARSAETEGLQAEA
jgi:DNA-binding GntR family transcriptional regulator